VALSGVVGESLLASYLLRGHSVLLDPGGVKMKTITSAAYLNA
jgi:hypothetical protein